MSFFFFLFIRGFENVKIEVRTKKIGPTYKTKKINNLGGMEGGCGGVKRKHKTYHDLQTYVHSSQYKGLAQPQGSLGPLFFFFLHVVTLPLKKTQ